MVHATVGKERMMKMLYGDVSDSITKFKIGTGTTAFTAASTDLTTPITWGSLQLHNFTSHTYTSGTTTMEARCDITTTDYTGNISEFGVFTASGTMVYAETFSPYYKDGSTNVRIIAKQRHL
jgi:hypothetical protein